MIIHPEGDHLDGMLITFMKNLNKGTFSGRSPSQKVRYFNELKIMLLLANQLDFFLEHNNSQWDIQIRNDTLSAFRSYFSRNSQNKEANIKQIAGIYNTRVVAALKELLN